MASSISFFECEEIIKKFQLEIKNYKTFIETGSLNGDTISNMFYHFENVHSIELSEHFFNHCKNRFKDNENVTMHFGDSSIVLPELIQKINTDTIFFLDGHWSNCGTARGEKDCPLLEELNAIVNTFKHNSLIVIDDLRLFGTNINEDWSEITEENILKIFGDRKIKTLSQNDRFIIFLEKI
jgi:hypothetical protein